MKMPGSSVIDVILELWVFATVTQSFFLISVVLNVIFFNSKEQCTEMEFAHVGICTQ